ncbi:hypothetical protein GSY71_16005 [Pusillimonas sp. TS35]|nr:hypothetical protein [Pusillimonas sp. TS35]
MEPIPEDFPRRVMSGAVGGAAPKFLARKNDDGSYSAYACEDEHRQAYENAESLARELKTYALRKERENPDWTREFNLNRIKEGIVEKVRNFEWDFTADEQAWIMLRLTRLLDE